MVVKAPLAQAPRGPGTGLPPERQCAGLEGKAGGRGAARGAGRLPATGLGGGREAGAGGGRHRRGRRGRA